MERILFYLLSALFRGFTGYILVRYPLTGATSLTLILASFFIVGGPSAQLAQRCAPVSALGVVYFQRDRFRNAWNHVDRADAGIERLVYRICDWG